MPEKVKIKVTPEEGRAIVWEENQDYKVISDEICENRRWSALRKCIVEHLPDNTYWRTYYSVGLTECQDEQPFEYASEAELTQVEKKEVTSFAWVPIEK